MVNEERLLALFRELVLIDAPSLAERPCVDRVKQILAEMGLDPVEDNAGDAIGGDAGNVIAVLKGNKPGAPRIFLSAHFDTVEPTKGLKLVEEDGVIRSDGTTILGADDKGGMAPAIEAVRMLQETGAEHGDLVLLFSVAEEVGLKGAANLKVEDLNLDFGYVLDTGPPVGTFVTRTATHDKLEVTIIGKPAHSGKDPEKGINAIQVMADAIAPMRLGRIGPETTANFGIVEGGTAVNVVCPFVKLRGEARSTDVAELDKQIDHMLQCLEAAARKWGAQLKVDHDRHYDAYLIDPDSKVVQVAQRSSRNLGFDPALRTTLGGSDANVYNAKGVPCVVLGTGMDKIHTHEEYIKVKDLVDTARLAYELVVEAARS